MTNCPKCRRRLAFPSLAAKVRCPHCSEVFAPPALGDEAETRTLDPSSTADFASPPADTNPATLTLDLDGPPKADTSLELQKIGRFEIRRFLGEGAFGAVYEAYDPQLDRAVAIKIAKLGHADSDQRIKRFLREAKSAAGLRHPHIVPVHEFGQEGDQFYIVSSFIKGRTLQADLDERIENKHLADLPRAARIVQQLAEALAYAHGQGIVHRDVKPANVMLDEKDEPMLMDFGLATRLEEAEKLTHAGAVLGTPLYMAPEQARGKGAKALSASDQYSLGVMLYEMIAGVPPFEGTPELVMFHHIETEPTSPRKHDPRINRDLATICLKCMRKNASDRYASTADLADDLRALLEERTISARPLSTMESGAKWVKKNPGFAALLVLTAFSLILGSSFSIWQAIRARSNEEKALDLSGKNQDLASKESRAKNAAIDARKDAERNAANIAIDRGLLGCESGDTASGLLWLAHGLQLAEKIEHQDSIRVARYNIANWLAQRSPITLEGFVPLPGRVFSLAVGSDRKTIAVGTENGMVALVNIQEGKILHLFRNRSRTIRSIAWSPATSEFWSASFDGFVDIIDPKTQKIVANLPHEGMVYSVAFSQDGEIGATGDNSGKLRVWNTRSRKEILTAKSLSSGVHGVAVSPKGTLIAATCWDGTAWILDAKNGKSIGGPLPHPGGVWTATFSPDESKLFTGCYDGQVRCWETVANRKLLHQISHPNEIYSIQFSPNGSTFLTGGRDRTLRLWDAKTHQLISDQWRQDIDVIGASFTPDGKSIIASGMSSVRSYRIPPRPAPNRFLKGEILGADWIVLTYSPNFQSLYAGAGAPGLLGKWDLKGTSNELVGRYQMEDYVSGVRITSDGKQLFTAGNRGGLHRVNSENMTRMGRPLAPGASSVAFRDWDNRLAFGTYGSSMVLDSVSGLPIGATLPHGGNVVGVEFCPKRDHILGTASWDRRGRIWDWQTGKVIHELVHPDDVHRIKFRFDGKQFATSGVDGRIRIWDLESGKQIREIKGHSGEVRALHWTSNGQMIISGGGDRKVRFWDSETGKTLRPDLECSEEVWGIALRPDETELAIGIRSKGVELVPLIPPIQDSVDKIILGLEVGTGLRISDAQMIVELTPAEWTQKEADLRILQGLP